MYLIVCLPSFYAKLTFYIKQQIHFSIYYLKKDEKSLAIEELCKTVKYKILQFLFDTRNKNKQNFYSYLVRAGKITRSKHISSLFKTKVRRWVEKKINSLCWNKKNIYKIMSRQVYFKRIDLSITYKNSGSSSEMKFLQMKVNQPTYFKVIKQERGEYDAKQQFVSR